MRWVGLRVISTGLFASVLTLTQAIHHVDILCSDVCIIVCCVRVCFGMRVWDVLSLLSPTNSYMPIGYLSTTTDSNNTFLIDLFFFLYLSFIFSYKGLMMQWKPHQNTGKYSSFNAVYWWQCQSKFIVVILVSYWGTFSLCPIKFQNSIPHNKTKQVHVSNYSCLTKM